MAYVRKTESEIHIEGKYHMGWETVCIFSNNEMKEAEACLKEYFENEPEFEHRLIGRRKAK